MAASTLQVPQLRGHDGSADQRDVRQAGPGDTLLCRTVKTRPRAVGSHAVVAFDEWQTAEALHEICREHARERGCGQGAHASADSPPDQRIRQRPAHPVAAGQHQRPHHAQHEPRWHVHLQRRTVRGPTWSVQQCGRGLESQLPGPESHGAQRGGAGDGGGAQVDRHHPLRALGQLARGRHAGSVPV